MTQPSFVPIVEADQVRDAYQMHAPRHWRATRPADHRGGPTPRRREFGTPGPDQGYALLVAERLFADRVQLTEGESVHDALAAAAEVGAARAALFGRAPVGKDVELALALFGLLGDAPADLVAWRQPRIRSCAHEYRLRRALVDLVPEETLRLTPDEVRARSGRWRELFADDGHPAPSTTATGPASESGEAAEAEEAADPD